MSNSKLHLILHLRNNTKMKASVLRSSLLVPGVSALQSHAPFEVSEFMGLDFIQNAIKTPAKPQSVLSFFFGVNYNDPDGKYKEVMRDGVQVVKRMNDIWFKGDKRYDLFCREPFADVIRDAGMGRLQWNDSIDGLMAQLVLCDQISRNAFRSTDEAFAFDDRAFIVADELMKSAVSKTPSLVGDFFPPYYVFLITALMHSESKQIHEEVISFIPFVKEKAPQLNDYWDFQLQFELQHKAVIDRFGRYPHRNKFKGRTSTLQEQEYLNDKDNLPGWAKM